MAVSLNHPLCTSRFADAVGIYAASAGEVTSRAARVDLDLARHLTPLAIGVKIACRGKKRRSA